MLSMLRKKVKLAKHIVKVIQNFSSSKDSNLALIIHVLYSLSFLLMIAIPAVSLSDSTAISPPTVNPINPPNSVLMMDSGAYNFDGTDSTWNSTFTTKRLCPSTYSPYFVFIPNITWDPDGGNAMQVVFNSLTTNSANYTVNFEKQYGQDSGGIAFTWVMYCYPSSMSVPGYLPYGGGF
jgi:hypothetical protein